jgi:ribosomal protein S18 acetylase RimI-like enzyme
MTEIRPATPADVEALAAHHHHSRREEFSGTIPDSALDALSVEERLTQWRSWLSPEMPHNTRVATQTEERIVGHVTVLDDEIMHVYVTPDHWRQGIGSLLLVAGERLLRAAGHARIVLQTHDLNHRAIGLYSSNGWRITDEQVTFQVAGHSVAGHVLEKHF